MDTGVIYVCVFVSYGQEKQIDGVSIYAKQTFGIIIKNTGVGGGVQLHFGFLHNAKPAAALVLMARGRY